MVVARSVSLALHQAEQIGMAPGVLLAARVVPEVLAAQGRLTKEDPAGSGYGYS